MKIHNSSDDSIVWKELKKDIDSYIPDDVIQIDTGSQPIENTINQVLEKIGVKSKQ